MRTDAPSVAEIDLYQSSTRGCHGANSAINRRQKLRSFLSRCRYGGDLHRRKRWCNLFRCPCLSTPGKHQAGRYSVATRNLSHLRVNRQSVRFKAEGIDLPLSTLADQVGHGTFAVMPLFVAQMNYSKIRNRRRASAGICLQ
ncbi:hypothetical protein ABIE91_000823 [Bradyrhizobium elkanii]